MPSRLPKLLHLTAGLLILGAVALVAGDALNAAHSSQPPAGAVGWLLLVLKDALVPLGLAAILFATAAILSRPAASLSPDLAPVEAHRLTDSIEDVRVAIADLSLALKTRPSPMPRPTPAVSAASMPTSDDVAQALQRIIALFEEIRQLTLLDDRGRAALLNDQRQQHKTAAIAEATTLQHALQWARADEVLQALEKEIPGDADIAKARQDLADRRAASENQAISRASGAVEDLMAIGNWDQAVQSAEELVRNFPENPAALSVQARVARERELSEENAAQRMYEEVKQATERRQWQRALTAARQLLERFPGHRRAEKVREQYATIQSNADIEQRQDAEAKLQDLIRSKRFIEAVAMAENILEKYPLSPQAASLEEMLPKMRAMAIEQELDAEVR